MLPRPLRPGPQWFRTVFALRTSSKSCRALALAVVMVVALAPVASASGPQVTAASDWDEQNTGSTAYLLDACFVNDAIGWAVGSPGAILKTEDGGETWTEQHTGTEDFVSIDAVDEDHAWAMVHVDGADGLIVRTGNGGEDWELIHTKTPDMPVPTMIGAVDFIDARVGFIVGAMTDGFDYFDAIFKTEDAGDTFKLVHKGHVFTASGGGYRASCFIDRDHGWVTGYGGNTVRTTDGGDTWTYVAPTVVSGQFGASTDVWFVDEETGFVATNEYGVSATEDGGDHWTQVTNAITGTEYLGDIYFADENHGWVCGSGTSSQSYGIRETFDGGETWDVPTGVPASANALSFPAPNIGWATGAFGEVWNTRSLATTRRAGASRYDTAVEISKAAYPNGSHFVVIATGQNYPDALAGAALAEAHDAPLLLVSSVVPEVVRAEVARLDPGEVIILGGEGAVSQEIADWFMAEGMNMTRIGGTNRYETAAMIAEKVREALWGIPGDTAIIATGINFPDALAGSPLSAAMGWPILLVKPDEVPAATAEAIADFGITKTIVLGAEQAVSPAVANHLPNATRLGGADRYGTMGEIAEYAYTHAGLGRTYVSLAVGSNFPDALTGGALTARHNGVMLLTPADSLAPAAAEYLQDRGEGVAVLDVYGGTGVVQQSVVDAAANILE